MQLTLRQCEYFLALAQTGQVSKAALRCNVSQSSVTIALRALEKSLDVSLFVRHAKGLRLTEAGERFVHHARHVLDAANRAVEDIQTTPGDISGRLRVGVTETISAYLAPTVLAAAEQRFPGLRIELIENTRPNIEQGLAEGAIDFALLIVSNLTHVDSLEYHTVLKSSRRLWTHADHPLQQKPSISLRDIAKQDFILLDMDEHIDTMRKYWARHKLTPRIGFQSKSLEAVRSLVAFEKGVTILSDLVYRPWSLEGRRLLRRDVAEAIPSMDIGGVWRRGDQHGRKREALLRVINASIKATAGD